MFLPIAAKKLLLLGSIRLMNIYNINSESIKDDEAQSVPNSSKITFLMDKKRWDSRGPPIDSSIGVPTANIFVRSDRCSDVSERYL